MVLFLWMLRLVLQVITSGEKFAELQQQMYADMKNMIANQLVLHEYDPETEYDIHMRSVLMLWRFFHTGTFIELCITVC